MIVRPNTKSGGTNMKEVQLNKKSKVVEFDSLGEFYNYITETKINDVFDGRTLSSIDGSWEFTKTESFEEAIDLFKAGWSDMATKLTQRMKVIENNAQPTMRPKNVNSVCGYQAIVPLFLQGVPTNMASKRMVPIKQKVITINKSIDYSARTSSDKIIEESIKALQIVKKLEAQGYRCNLNIVLGSTAGVPEKQFLIKVRIKSANEKLNISKLAFPLVHPSMLRRLFFRFIEVYPEVTSSFYWGYGRPAKSEELREFFKNEYLIPNFVQKDVNSIKNIDDLESI